eukprot:5478274-Ditylum_brightwellii.AAC.1
MGANHGINSPKAYTKGSRAIDITVATEDPTHSSESRDVTVNVRLALDHRGMLCDLNIHHLLYSKSYKINHSKHRKLYTKYKKNEYGAEVSIQLKEKKIIEQVQILDTPTKTTFSLDNQEELHQLDEDIGTAMVDPEHTIQTFHQP